MTERYRCLLLFGAPGVGKGTQGKMLGQKAEFVHLATGDIFRSLDRQSELGRKFVEYSSRGELVPDDLTVQLWREYVRGLIASGRYRPAHQVLVLDGIPRSLPQARMIEPYIFPLRVIHLAAPNIDEMVRRMRVRSEKEGRHDDMDEGVVRRRFEVYERETAPVLSFYPRNLIEEVDAIGSIEEVHARLTAVVARIYTPSH